MLSLLKYTKIITYKRHVSMGLVGGLAVTWAFFFFAPFNVTAVVPLHMDSYFGVDYVAPAFQLFVIPVVATVVTVLHGLLIWRTSSDEHIARGVLLVTNGVVIILSWAALGWILVIQRYAP